MTVGIIYNIRHAVRPSVMDTVFHEVATPTTFRADSVEFFNLAAYVNPEV
jgi:hypothetical protein